MKKSNHRLTTRRSFLRGSAALAGKALVPSWAVSNLPSLSQARTIAGFDSDFLERFIHRAAGNSLDLMGLRDNIFEARKLIESGGRSSISSAQDTAIHTIIDNIIGNWSVVHFDITDAIATPRLPEVFDTVSELIDNRKALDPNFRTPQQLKHLSEQMITIVCEVMPELEECMTDELRASRHPLSAADVRYKNIDTEFLMPDIDQQRIQFDATAMRFLARRDFLVLNNVMNDSHTLPHELEQLLLEHDSSAFNWAERHVRGYPTDFFRKNFGLKQPPFPEVDGALLDYLIDVRDGFDALAEGFVFPSGSCPHILSKALSGFKAPVTELRQPGTEAEADELKKLFSEDALDYWEADKIIMNDGISIGTEMYRNGVVFTFSFEENLVHGIPKAQTALESITKTAMFCTDLQDKTLKAYAQEKDGYDASLIYLFCDRKGYHGALLEHLNTVSGEVVDPRVPSAENPNTLPIRGL